VPWKVAINRAARTVFAEWDDFGFLFGVCDDAVWAVLNTPAGGVLRDRPEFPAPADLGANANPDALRLPLRKKLTAVADLPSHIVAFRGTLGRLTTVGQVPLALAAYRWFLATLSPFPVFQQYTLLFTVAHGAIAKV
jgi:hypothetical protein